MTHSIISTFVMLFVVGFILWLLPRLTIDTAIAQIIRALLITLVVIDLIAFILDASGIFPNKYHL